MEPQIRYARTSDGVSIAYYVMGSGPTLIAMPAGLHQSIEFDAKTSNFREAAERSARAFTYVRYDPRGSGLSDRDVEDDFSVETMARDLEAVADAIPAAQFLLFAPGSMSLAAIWFASRHPERVARLVLWVPSDRGADYLRAPIDALLESTDSDWRLASEAVIQSVDLWDNPDLAQQNAANMRASVDPRVYTRFRRAMRGWDVSATLPDVRCPTLVIHPAANPYAPVAQARRVAAGIPGARFVLVDTPSLLMPGSEVVRASGLFFLDREPRPYAPAEPPRGTAVIMFVDVADSTSLTERIGDAAFRVRARELDSALRSAVGQHGGRVIDAKTLGDGILATFGGASQAIAAALRCSAEGDRSGLPLHIGLHAGDVIREEGNVFGGAVNIAARISDLSAAGEILLSGTVRDLARTSADVAFEDRGEHVLKGIAEAVRVFTVRKT